MRSRIESSLTVFKAIGCGDHRRSASAGVCFENIARHGVAGDRCHAPRTAARLSPCISRAPPFIASTLDAFDVELDQVFSGKPKILPSSSRFVEAR